MGGGRRGEDNEIKMMVYFPKEGTKAGETTKARGRRAMKSGNPVHTTKPFSLINEWMDAAAGSKKLFEVGQGANFRTLPSPPPPKYQNFKKVPKLLQMLFRSSFLTRMVGKFPSDASFPHIFFAPVLSPLFFQRETPFLRGGGRFEGGRERKIRIASSCQTKPAIRPSMAST